MDKMKKKQNHIGLQLDQRETLEQQIINLQEEIAQLPTLTDFIVAVNETEYQVKYFISHYGGGHESNILEHHRAQLEALKQSLCEAKKSSESRREQEERLREELGLLKLQYAKLNFDGHEDELLQLQHRLVIVEQKAAEIESIISDHQEKIANARDSVPASSELEVERESLLADIATGESQESELAKLDQQIASAQEKLLKKSDLATKVIRQSEQTIIGLQRKLDAFEQEASNLKGRLIPYATGLFLHSQAELIGCEYVAAGLELIEKYKQLSALDRMLDKIEFNKKLILPNSGELTIPLFNVPSCVDLKQNHLTRNFYCYPFFKNHEIIMENEKQIKSDFLKKGINI